ncbi:MAG TPA: bifunctional DNA-binding transcriptional regulator/O6-methylguanine-DNA methyltransferase Ada [Nannocystaceae bacterium]|nr:bifunctional DNA-binding transcriptional regulator/O6-methylguanine-DNA methyltransferase Ada [Nannocystaceae bacterium]
MNTTLPSFTDNHARWTAVATRDAAADDVFVYSVRTTGVYCRPSCAARLARRENVAFHATPAAAERAGFRACKRCRPSEPPRRERDAALVVRACRLIDAADEPIELERLADAVGLSPFHFHRVFKATTGLTPRAYGAARRAARVRDELARSSTVTAAIYGAGFASSGRFYSSSARVLGMTPSDYRAGGTRTAMRFAIETCSLGSILVAESGIGVCAILFGDDPEALVRELHERFPNASVVGGDPEFARRVAAVVAFVEAPRIGLALPLDIRGTAFQRRVWQALTEIPVGTTTSYTDIAARLGAPRAVRAVAQACAANPLAVAIPCHRVVRKGGELSGYRWGLARKRALLEREAS